MSSTLHLYAETKLELGWVPVPFDERRRKKNPIDLTEELGGEHLGHLMALFGMGYQRHVRGSVEPIAPHRGLPSDLGDFYREWWYRGGWGAGLGLSWLSAAEVINYGWDEKRATYRACVHRLYADLFDASSSFPDDFPDDAAMYIRRPPNSNTVWVEWESSCRDFVNQDYDTCVEDLLSCLLKLGDPATTRVIFWHY